MGWAFDSIWELRVPSSEVEAISDPLVGIGLTDLLNPRLPGTLGTRTNKNPDGDSEHVSK